jgi:hypothetical protein
LKKESLSPDPEAQIESKKPEVQKPAAKKLKSELFKALHASFSSSLLFFFSFFLVIVQYPFIILLQSQELVL